MRRLTVALDPAYDVLVGAGALDELPFLLAGRRRVVVVTHERLLELHGVALERALGDGELSALVTMGEGEDAKSLATIERLCRRFVGADLLRGDAVVAFGGGVVGDTAGFAAAVYHRGVSVVQVPTTLLAQVDAAIGGKTAVNLPEGKNLVGAFHQPIGVLADVTLLGTLGPREFRAGLGEVAKYALMPDGVDVAAIVERSPEKVLERDAGALEGLVAGCAAIKAAVVAADPHERTGLRASLNYGHTLAHALETAGHYDLHHGEAVAIGLVFAGHLASALERIGPAELERHHDLVAALGLPVVVPGEAASGAELLALMRRDKKAKGGLTFVLPGPDGLETVDDPPAPAIETALRAVGVEG